MHFLIQNNQLKCYIDCFAHINVMFHFLAWFMHMLFGPFVWIDILPKIYFVIILTCNVIHKMFLYVVQGVSPFF